MFNNFDLAFDEIDSKRYGKTVRKATPEEIEKYRIRMRTDFVKLDKGCLTYLAGEKYPMRANVGPDADVFIVARAKRLVPLLIKFVKGENAFQRAFRIISFTQYQALIINWLDFTLHDAYYNDSDRYSQPVRELYRVLPERVRNILCAIFEHDTAYRYRLQDLIVEVNKDSLNKNPVKEISRIIALADSRQIPCKDCGKKYGMSKLTPYKHYLLWYLRLNRKLTRQIVEIFNELKIDELRFSVEDQYWIYTAEDYNYEGLDFITRHQLRETL